MELLRQTRAQSPALADYLAAVIARANGPLPADGICVHLWRFEHAATLHDWIDHDYRRALAAALIAAWRDGLRRTTTHAWRVMLYQDTMPSLAAYPMKHADAPLPGTAKQVPHPGDVLLAYHHAPWPSDDALPAYVPDTDAILGVIAQHEGSLGRQSAKALGLKPGSLRFVVEQEGLASAVNTIRADHGRPLARFRAPISAAEQTYLFYTETTA